MKPHALADSLCRTLEMFQVLEAQPPLPEPEPQMRAELGKRGLYRTTGDLTGGGKVQELPMLWVLNLSDGEHSLLDIAERSGYPFGAILRAAEALQGVELLREVR